MFWFGRLDVHSLIIGHYSVGKLSIFGHASNSVQFIKCTTHAQLAISRAKRESRCSDMHRNVLMAPQTQSLLTYFSAFSNDLLADFSLCYPFSIHIVFPSKNIRISNAFLRTLPSVSAPLWSLTVLTHGCTQDQHCDILRCAFFIWPMNHTLRGISAYKPYPDNQWKEKNGQIFNKQWIHEDKNEIKIHNIWTLIINF